MFLRNHHILSGQYTVLDDICLHWFVLNQVMHILFIINTWSVPYNIVLSLKLQFWEKWDWKFLQFCLLCKDWQVPRWRNNYDRIEVVTLKYLRWTYNHLTICKTVWWKTCKADFTHYCREICVLYFFGSKFSDCDAWVTILIF